LTIKFNGVAITGLKSIVVDSDQGTVVAAVPEDSNDFTSVLTTPSINARLQYAINLQSSPDNALEPVFSLTFDIVHGPASIAKVEQSVLNTIARAPLQVQGASPGALSILFTDAFGNLAASVNELFEVLVTGPFDLTSPDEMR
jgi:hypothetical protein